MLIKKMNKELESLHQVTKYVDRYLRVEQNLKPVDVMLLMGSNSTTTPIRAGRLLRRKIAPLMVITGGIGTRTKQKEESEAARFKRIIQQRFSPRAPILLEERATNTGQNVTFTRSLLREANIHPRSILVVTVPFGERRAAANFARQWPELKELLVTSPKLNFDRYWQEKQ